MAGEGEKSWVFRARRRDHGSGRSTVASLGAMLAECQGIRDVAEVEELGAWGGASGLRPSRFVESHGFVESHDDFI